eukprot:1194369-Prorocentrum_minimum.AAC.3
MAHSVNTVQRNYGYTVVDRLGRISIVTIVTLYCVYTCLHCFVCVPLLTYLGAELVDAHLLDEVHDARLLPVLAGAKVAEGGEHGVREGHQLGLVHPRPQRDGALALHSAEEAPHLPKPSTNRT